MQTSTDVPKPVLRTEETDDDNVSPIADFKGVWYNARVDAVRKYVPCALFVKSFYCTLFFSLKTMYIGFFFPEVRDYSLRRAF